MPKSNAKYPFQYKVLEKVGELGINLFGETRERLGFIIELDEAGQVSKTVGEEQNPDFLQLDEQFNSYILFDVFDSGVYVYLSWRNVNSDHLKALLNLTLDDTDFDGFEGARGNTCPQSHSVMF